MYTQSLPQLIQALQQRKISSVEVTKHYLQRITQNHTLNAFITIDEQHALTSATHADAALKKGNAPLLTGIPMAHKDIFCTTTMPTTCGSKMLEKFISPYDATVVKRIATAGAIMLGKTNMDEFAMGSTNENSYFGPVKNPWDHTRVPGGSSGGSAASVAADLVPFATGSDTGGSIRQPAAFCGISGIKPTYGLISRFGMIAYASSLDQAGPMARSAEDLAIILQAMVGFDENDSTSLSQPFISYTEQLNKSLKGIRIGVPSYCFHSQVETPIQDAIRGAINTLQQAGAEIIEIDLTLHSLWVSCYYVIACAEASSNLARFDGIRFGHRTVHAENLRDLITHSRNEGFGLEVKRRILTGTYVLSSGYFDDYYIQAQKIRRMIVMELQQTLSNVDLILGPTTPTCAPNLNKNDAHDPIQQYLGDVFTVVANLAGMPALSIPAGFNEGLPIGLQLMGNHFSEARLLNVAHIYQQYTDWHLAKPECGETI